MKILREDHPNRDRVIKKDIDAIVVKLNDGTKLRITDQKGVGVTVTEISARSGILCVVPQFGNQILLTCTVSRAK